MIALICSSCGWITIRRTRPADELRGCAKHKDLPVVVQAAGMERLLETLACHLGGTMPPDQAIRRIEIAKAAWKKRQLLNREDRKSGAKFLAPAKEARRELKKASKRFDRRKRFGKL